MTARATVFSRGRRADAAPWTASDERRVTAWLRGVVAGDPPALGELDAGTERLLRTNRLDLLAFSTGASSPRRAAREIVADVKARRVAAAARSACDTLEEDGIECVVLKGAPLAERFWGAAWVRESSDVDLLVRPQDAARAMAALRRGGYHKAEEWVPGWYERRWFYHEAVVAPEQGAPAVELHWDYLRSGFAHTDVGALIAAREPVETCGVTLPSPSVAWQLVANSAHCVHELCRARLLLDVALIARAATEDDRRAALMEARRSGAGVLLYCSIIASAAHLGWRPAAEFEALRPSALRDAAARRYLSGLPLYTSASRAALQLHHFANPLLTCDGAGWPARLPYSLLTDRGHLAGDIERVRRRVAARLGR